jgi:hypothetical protein
MGNVEIWKFLTPKKCKIFAWLALGLNTRERLVNRSIIQEASCPFGCQTDEVLEHLFFLCPHTSSLWHNLPIFSMQGIHTIQAGYVNKSKSGAPVTQERVGNHLHSGCMHYMAGQKMNVSTPAGLMKGNCMEIIKLYYGPMEAKKLNVGKQLEN